MPSGYTEDHLVEMIEEYNGGALGIEQFFEELVNFSKDLNEEGQRHIRERLSERELAVFDILTRPGPALTNRETAEIKKIFRDMLAKLKTEKLVLDWRDRRHSRAAVRVAVEEMLDSGLREKYTVEFFEQKCGALFQHLLEKYPKKDAGIQVFATILRRDSPLHGLYSVFPSAAPANRFPTILVPIKTRIVGNPREIPAAPRRTGSLRTERGYAFLPPMSVRVEDRFLDALRSIRGSGCFCMSGEMPFVFPALRLKGSEEEIAFPLPEAQARALREASEAAPYGLGEETKLDPSVRHCRQIDAEDLVFGNPAWRGAVELLATAAGEELGIPEPVKAVPYKLLLYEEGGQFAPHRDTEKVPGMFGSLIVSLPSKHEGGELIVRHGGRGEHIDFAAAQTNLLSIPYAAFFADCEHEVRPVTSGRRLCLAYHLVVAGRKKKTDLGAPSPGAEQLAPFLAEKADDGDLTAVLLEHRYTETDFSVTELKGDDRARADALFGAAGEAGFEARLALVTLHRVGELEVTYAPRRGRWQFDDVDEDDGEMGEVYDETLTLDHWRTPEDGSPGLGTFEIMADRILATSPIDAAEPDEAYAEGFTGNAGCTMEHWYCRAAVVLWPARADYEVLVRYDFASACRRFEKEAKRKGRKGPAFRKLGNTLLAATASRLEGVSMHNADHYARTMRPLLRGIASGADRELYERVATDEFLPLFAMAGRETWRTLLGAFGSEPLEWFAARTAEENLEAHAGSLFRGLDAALKKGGDPARPVASRIGGWLEAPEPPKRSLLPLHDDEDRDDDDDSLASRFHTTLAASGLIEAEGDREDCAARLRGDGDLDHICEKLGPALLETRHRARLSKPGSLAPNLWREAVAILADEVERPLPPYPDWTRPIPDEETQNALIRELLEFLADPDREEHRFARAERDRDRLADYVKSHELDLDLRTERKGRPYTLVCRKNDQSHRRALQHRAADERLLKRLRKLDLGDG